MSDLSELTYLTFFFVFNETIFDTITSQGDMDSSSKSDIKI